VAEIVWGGHGAAHPGAERLAASIIGDAMRPAMPMRVSDWVERNIILVDGPFAGQMWSRRNAPYLVEPLDCLSEDAPCNVVTIRKSQQSGASIAALAWCLYVADRDPANLLYAVPGIDSLKDINTAKLQPLIDAWQRHTGRVVIRPQTSRSGEGSTTYEKIFERTGRVWLANSNSVMDLSSKTAKKGVKDELSKWAPIPGAQDPEDLFFGRFTAFRASGDWKILEISTPEFDSGDETGNDPRHCRIDRSFRQSDQRFYHIACPECGSLQFQRFDQFRIDAKAPHKSDYECEGCGHRVSEAERRMQLQPENGARWIAQKPGGARHPGFHIDGFMSLLMSYEAMAEDYLKSQGSEVGLKGYWNLNLGLPRHMATTAPDFNRLLDRRQQHLIRGHIPPGGLLLTAAADVQMRGIWLEIVAWGSDGQSWLVDAIYIGGETDAPDAPVFDRLKREALQRVFPDAYGRERRIDALGIDSGYRANVVYSWVRANQAMHPETGRDLIYALKGLDGWGRPPLGQPSLQDIALDGRKIAQGCRVWPVGTWPLKGDVYLALEKAPPLNPSRSVPGLCHFGEWVDEEYFRQLTAAHLEDVTVRGIVTNRRWVDLRENHFLDCRVYNTALAHHLGLISMSPTEWAVVERARGRPIDPPAPLFDRQPDEPVLPKPETAFFAPARNGWFADRLGRK
jgi:phage terminase large subunit GpA-like protein